MSFLGNRLTLHSPSRGFTMELGAAIAVIIATRLSMLSLFPPKRQCLTSCACRAPRLHHTVYHRLYSGCWPVQRHLENDQLENGSLDLHGLDHHPPLRRDHFRLFSWHHRERASLGYAQLAQLI